MFKLCNRCRKGTIEPKEHVVIDASTGTTVLILCAICDDIFYQEFTSKSTKIEFDKLQYGRNFNTNDNSTSKAD